jgi:predicted enzyme related to lactoylglutathione lyase
MGRVIHFEIHASDLERASKFYTEVFGWTIHKWDGPVEYYLVATGERDGIDGGILPRRGETPEIGAPVNAFVCTVGVASLEDAIAAVERAGGTIVVPKNEIPGVGWLCYANDTEGNIFGMMQPV